MKCQRRKTITKTKEIDLLIIGGGPAGLCAAISGASEGLNITLLDNGASLGGQARESSAIENYPGFPGGVTGDKLMGCFVQQAHDFHANFISPLQAARLHRDDVANRIIVETDDYSEYVSKSVLISIGLQYRRLNANGISPLMGRGVYYGAPSSIIAEPAPRKIAIVGGANSAGQAVIKLASNPENKIKMVIRKELHLQMSQYLVDRIRKLENVEVCEHCEITEVYGRTELEYVTIKQDGKSIQEEMDCVFIFIGAMPRTLWLGGTLQLDKDRYIITGLDVTDTMALPYETSMQGVFAAGDVRHGSTKRVAVAAGEGAAALQQIHGYLAGINGK